MKEECKEGTLCYVSAYQKLLRKKKQKEKKENGTHKNEKVN